MLDLGRHRDWLFAKDRDLELPEFCLGDILARPAPFIEMAQKALDGWRGGRLGIHGPFAGFELDVKDREIRPIVQRRIDQALDVCEALGGAVQMVLHSPYDRWDACNLDRTPGERATRIAAILDTLEPALIRARDIGVQIVLENIRDTDPADRMAVVLAADTPALALSVDTGHAHWAHWVDGGAPPADRYISAAGGTRLGHVHLQDTDGWADRHWALGGEGNIVWPAIFKALEAATPSLI